jgi:hypothetical protein
VAPAKVHAPVEKLQPAERGSKSSTPKAAMTKANASLGANSTEVQNTPGWLAAHKLCSCGSL